MTARRLWAIRHAPTLADGRCVGASDVPTKLAPEAAAARMLERLPAGAFAAVCSSPRGRCADPARIVADALALPLRLEARLDEISFGAWEGRTWHEIESQEPATYTAWLADWISLAPPGGERVGVLAERVQSWWSELPAGDHLLVAHAGVVRALRVIANRSDWTAAMTTPVNHLDGEWFFAEGPTTA